MKAKFPRSSGILLHPTSLPSRFGIGDLGDEAYEFVDFLVSSGQSLWQVLPLGPTGFGDSPYQCFSAFAGNPLLVSPQRLVESGLLSSEDLHHVPRFSADRVDFGRVIDYKSGLLARAFENFRQTTDTGLRSDFLAFSQENHWLDGYALFRALKDAHSGASWNTWSPSLRESNPEAIASAREQLHYQIEAQKFYQYLFFKQWGALKSYANERDVYVLGDMPIFVAYDSADVWTHPRLFKLNPDGSPAVVAGVPPDYFSRTGQLWGNPIYNWDRMKQQGFAWWIDRLKATFRLVDLLRFDHFRGFAATWEVPAGEETAERGRWVEVPGRQLFAALKEAFADLPIIAEDLGVITPDVEALRDDCGFPGMRILQFAFSSDSRNIDLPHNYIPNSVVYTGTHDNDTTVGWFNSKVGEGSTRDAAQIKRERERCLKYLRSTGEEIHWDFIQTTFASVSCIAIVPAQDVLGLDSGARMNLPASREGNWNWRCRAHTLTRSISKRLREITETYGRLHTVERPPAAQSTD